jgi:hypothetical protein
MTNDSLLAAAVDTSDSFGAVIVAVTLLGVIGAVMITAIVKYKQPDQVGKVWGMLGPLTGLAAGYMGTFFFTRNQIAEARDQAVQARDEVVQVRSEANDALRATHDNLTEVQRLLRETHVDELAKLPPEQLRSVFEHSPVPAPSTRPADWARQIQQVSRLVDSTRTSALSTANRISEIHPKETLRGRN